LTRAAARPYTLFRTVTVFIFIDPEAMGLQLTRGGEYAVRAMMYLGRHPVGHVSSLHDICREQDVPESFLAKIFQSLTRAGLVTSHRGAHGGFSLARPAHEITVRKVVEAIDGPIALNACVLWPEECQRSAGCPMHVVWEHAQERMMSVLDEVTVDALVTPVSVA
jgi:Rrf2 family transcriptional regulator, iron-sulfur cluster assembly transcription factor